jgi:pSer/pThr/pTyr-binding forkhead associated (FHA) protein
MAYLRLRDLASGEEQDFDRSLIRIGRDPELEIVPAGPVAEVVSAHHLRLMFDQGRWWVEDTGSSNGTYLNDQRLVPGEKQPLDGGSEVRLGRGGPHFSVVATSTSKVAPTRIEEVIDAAASTTPMAPIPSLDPAPDAYRSPASLSALTLRDESSDSAYECRGDRIRIGRARDCEVQLIRDDDTSVSRHHAEIETSNGRVTLRDLGSRNGTFVNGTRLAAPHELSLHDRIELGPGGPVLVVDAMTLPGAGSLPSAGPLPVHADRRVATGVSPAALGSGWARRRNSGGKGRTVFLEEVAEASPRRHSRGMRRVIWFGVALISLAVGGIYWFNESGARRTGLAVQDTTRPLVQQPSSDSLRPATTSEIRRLGHELAEARAASASATVVDSLRRELESAQATNLAAVAHANQAAVGLVRAYTDNEVVHGSGFILTPSGYFVTNRHVVMQTGRRADSVFITMADQRERVRTQVVSVPDSSGPDLAVLRIADYRGPAVAGVDWERDGAVQGEPASIIGFPARLGAAVEETATVRMSMNSGIFGRITADQVQVDGFTITGSSGSPIFNAAGEVVAVQRAGLQDAEGLSSAIPVSLVGPLLPRDARRALGLPPR